MTINNLITNISKALEVPSKIKYNNEIFEYNNDYQDYESVEAQDKFLFEYLFSNFRMKTFMYTTVEIIEEDKKMDFEEIEELTCNEYDIETRTINSLIKNQRKLIGEKENCQTVKILLKENQELKKQLDKAHDELYTLKNKYNIKLLNQISENIEPDCEDYYLAEIETKAHKYDLIQNQQKAFIKYLEDMLNDENDIFSVVRVKDVLQTYKETIGGNKDE